MALIDAEKLIDEDKLVDRATEKLVPALKQAATELLDGLTVTFTASVTFTRKGKGTGGVPVS